MPSGMVFRRIFSDYLHLLVWDLGFGIWDFGKRGLQNPSIRPNLSWETNERNKIKARLRFVAGCALLRF